MACIRRLQQTPTDPVCISDTSVSSVAVVRDLGVYLDADVSMATHVTGTVRACFAATGRYAVCGLHCRVMP